jgi:hypothetical protein
MWLPKSLYESLPSFYCVAGVGSLMTSLYVNDWYWPAICTGLGLVCLLIGLVVWLKRRDYRQSRSSRSREMKKSNELS